MAPLPGEGATSTVKQPLSKYALNEDMSMKAKLASMARRIEEFELRNVHTEAQPQTMPTSFEYIKPSQPYNPPSTSTINEYIFIGASHFNDKQSHGGLCRGNGKLPPQPHHNLQGTNAKRSRKVLKIDTLVGDCYDNSMDKPSIENHKVQDDKGLPEPFKASTSLGKRRERNSLDQMGRMPILFGIQGEFSMKWVCMMLAKIEVMVKTRELFPIDIIQCKSLMKDANFIWDPGKLKQDNIF
ncbi:hypothetical protein CK203_103404 [Vitis vinifera]|uniref:Uncharacterized protein n=1 Tax=Vitis vinifera TaxID=29760 RepID=A0A438BQR2_VITVI|nr:hypothetical protein CK203_103404 [Vitis vinifera]